MEDHARQELLEEYFSSSGVGAPEMEGFIWLKADSKKSWKKHYFVLRTSGLYYAPKGNKKSSKDLVCLSTFDVNQVYYGAGWKKKYKSPTDYCFAIKHPKIQAKTAKYIKYLCVDTEMEMHQWVTGIRVAKNGKQLFNNFRNIEEEMTHADIDILTSKRFSNNSLPINPNNPVKLNSPARTPCSENKSLDSALSSGIVADITPVNTIERNTVGQLRCQSSSSSSGCLSDQSTQSQQKGFETDYPMGGTIKKRPSVPKLPLTNTTRGIIRDSEDDSSSLGSGENVRVGSGGTLLRSAVRQSLRKNSFASSPGSSIQDLRVQVQVHTEEMKVQVHSEEMNCLPEEELPPPPRTESIEKLLDEMDLPPPPPEISEIYMPPSSLKKGPVQLHMNTNGPVKRISFDDDVQVIGVDDQTMRFTKHSYSANPRKLFTCQENQAVPPRAFLQDLQKVMDKKWQVAEKCRVEPNTLPHQVLGFRDNEMVGQGFEYNRDESVGAWVLQSQYYNEPLYAVCAKNSGGKKAMGLPVAPPVVLREPDYPPHHMNNLRSNRNIKRAPPPPKRSENTHLTTMMTT